MAGVLDDERDPLSFLADFPTPLTAQQRSDLSWYKSKFDVNRFRIAKVSQTFQTRRSQTERYISDLEAKLDALINGTTTATAATTSLAAATVVAANQHPSPSPLTAPASLPSAASSVAGTVHVNTPAQSSALAAAGAAAPYLSSSSSNHDHAIVADVAATCIGEKRPREADEAEPRTEATTGSAACGGEPTPALTASAPTPAPAPAPPPAPAPARRKFGGAFGGLLGGLVAEAKKDTSKDEALRKQREDMAKKAEEETIRKDIANGRAELADLDDRLAILNEKISNITAQHDELASILDSVDEEETAYASAFFMSTIGCTATCGYEISFRPAQMTEKVRNIIFSQVEAALDRYLAFRGRTDHFLIEIADQRAAKAQQEQQKQEEEEEEQRRMMLENNNNSNTANNNTINGGGGGIDNVSGLVAAVGLSPASVNLEGDVPGSGAGILGRGGAGILGTIDGSGLYLSGQASGGAMAPHVNSNNTNNNNNNNNNISRVPTDEEVMQLLLMGTSDPMSALDTAALMSGDEAAEGADGGFAYADDEDVDRYDY